MFIQSACATNIVSFLIASEHKCILLPHLFLLRSYPVCIKLNYSILSALKSTKEQKCYH